MMRDHELRASTLLSNNESAAIARAKNSRLLVALIAGLSPCSATPRLHCN